MVKLSAKVMIGLEQATNLRILAEQYERGVAFLEPNLSQTLASICFSSKMVAKRREAALRNTVERSQISLAPEFSIN